MPILRGSMTLDPERKAVCRYLPTTSFVIGGASILLYLSLFEVPLDLDRDKRISGRCATSTPRRKRIALTQCFTM